MYYVCSKSSWLEDLNIVAIFLDIQHSYLSWLICNYVIPVKSWNEAISWQVVWTYWTRDMWVPASQKYKLLQTLPMELYKFKSWKFDLCWNDKNSTLTYLLSLSFKNTILWVKILVKIWIPKVILFNWKILW